MLFSASAKAPVAEAYKTLRTNLRFSDLDNSLKVLLVTSASASEGKSTTASNLAITIAQADKRVLLADCDLRKPSVHHAFSIPNEKGLTNLLAEDLDFHEIVNYIGVPGLEVLTSGPKPPNPSELLGTARMEAFIKKASTEYDQVILDATPVLPVTDAAVLSRLADGVILVLSYGVTPGELAARAKESLEKVGARILGAVINNTPQKGLGGYGYYYYYGEKGRTRRRPRLMEQEETAGR